MYRETVADRKASIAAFDRIVDLVIAISKVVLGIDWAAKTAFVDSMTSTGTRSSAPFHQRARLI